MRLFHPIMIIFCCCFQALQGQDKDWPSMELDKVALVNQRESYITFPMDIGNLEPLMFEANVSPSFIIRKRMDSKLMGVVRTFFLCLSVSAVLGKRVQVFHKGSPVFFCFTQYLIQKMASSQNYVLVDPTLN